jgi:hypothetical protein
MTSLSKAFLKQAKKAGVKIHYSDPSLSNTNNQAEILRENNIEHYSHPIRRLSNEEERDYSFNLKAYQVMTPEEIIMSEDRELEYNSQKNWSFIEDLRRFQKESRMSKILAR